MKRIDKYRVLCEGLERCVPSHRPRAMAERRRQAEARQHMLSQPYTPPKPGRQEALS